MKMIVLGFFQPVKDCLVFKGAFYIGLILIRADFNIVKQ